jgi:hypothetical protein
MLAPERKPLLHSVKLTEARALSPLFDEAVRQEHPVLITRHDRESAILASRDAIARVLAAYQVHVDVIPEDEGGFTLWIRELDIGASGANLAAARQELLAVVRSYVRDYHQQFSFYRHLTDMAAREPYVLRLSLAQDDVELARFVFGTVATSPDSKSKPIIDAA